MSFVLDELKEDSSHVHKDRSLQREWPTDTHTPSTYDPWPIAFFFYNLNFTNKKRKMLLRVSLSLSLYWFYHFFSIGCCCRGTHTHSVFLSFLLCWSGVWYANLCWRKEREPGAAAAAQERKTPETCSVLLGCKLRHRCGARPSVPS